MKLRSVPFLARVTPAGGSLPQIVTVGTSSPGFGTSRTIPVPGAAIAGDRLVVLFEASNAPSSFTDDQGTTYTALSPTGADANRRTYVSAQLGATLPTTMTVTFGAGTFIEKADVFVVRGASGTMTDSGALSTAFGADPRSHAYTTGAANSFAFGVIDFTGGSVTGVTGADGDHTWSLTTGNGYSNTFGIVRPAAGSYGATLGPTGGSSASSGYWFTLGAA